MITRRGLLLSGIAAATAPAARAAEPEGLYLPELRSLDADVLAGDRGKIQPLAMQRALVGDEPGALAAWALQRTKPWPPLAVDFTGATAEPALDTILREAKGRRIVILNEAHHISRHRAFADVVARALRREGFDLLAAEAFDNDAEGSFNAEMRAGKAIDWELGLYTRDPVFAELMRHARSDGYRLAAYEQLPGQEAPSGASAIERRDAREAAQAANLVALLEANPDSRLFVYCGFSHLAETPHAGSSWMAARLKAATGIDPLTIDQSIGAPAPSPEQETPLVGAVLDHFKPREPIIVRRPDGGSWGGPLQDMVDLTVFHPRLPDDAGRPGWLAAASDRRRVVFKLPAGAGEAGLVQAVPEAEVQAPGVIPSDQYVKKPGAKEAVFFLRPGRYEVRLETGAGRRVLGRIQS